MFSKVKGSEFGVNAGETFCVCPSKCPHGSYSGGEGRITKVENGRFTATVEHSAICSSCGQAGYAVGDTVTGNITDLVPATYGVNCRWGGVGDESDEVTRE